MPGIIKGRKNDGRPYLPESDVRGPGLKVTASPVDPYVQTFKDSDTENLFKGLSGLLTEGGKLASFGAAEARTKAERETAKAAGVPGTAGQPQHKEKPSGGALGAIFSTAYQAGYDKMDGEFLASQYQREMEALYREDRNLTKQEFDVKASALRTKYLGALVSDDHLDGFLPKATKVEETILGEHSAYQVALVQSKLAETTSANIRNRLLDDIIMPSLKAMNINSLEELQTAEGIKKFQANLSIWKLEANPRLHAQLASFHRELKNNFSTPQITEMYVGILSQIAGDALAPEILDFTAIRDNDKMTVRDRNDTKGNPFGPMIMDIQKSLENRRHTVMNQLKEQERRDNLEAFHQASTEFTLDASHLWEKGKDFPLALADLRRRYDEILRMPGVTAGQAAELNAILDSKIKRGEHPAASTKKYLDQFYNLYRFGKADVGWVADNWREFTEPDYDRLLSLAAQQGNARNEKNAEKRDAYFTDRKMNELAYEEIEKDVNPTDPLGTGRLDDMGWRKAIDAREMMSRLSNEWSAKNNWKAPDAEALAKIRAEVRTKYPPFVEPTAEQFERTREKLLADERFPQTLEEFKKSYKEMSSLERYVVGTILNGGSPPKPRKKKQ